MRKVWFMALLGASMAANAAIYQWVDSNGVVNYSSTPHPGSTSVNLNAAPYSVVPVQGPSLNQSNNKANSDNAAAVANPGQSNAAINNALSIVSPSDQATFQNQPVIPVQFNFSGSLPEGGTFNLYLDGKVASSLAKGTSFSLSNVPRGMHTLQVKALDQSGNTLAESQSITVYVHQHAVQLLKTGQ